MVQTTVGSKWLKIRIVFSEEKAAWCIYIMIKKRSEYTENRANFRPGFVLLFSQYFV